MKKLVFGFILSVFTLTFAGCSEEIDESTRFVFHDPVITEYLSKHEEYSEYNKLLKAVPLSDLSETTAWQLLSARGHYTVFAPTNEAIQEYLDTLAANGLFLTGPSWDASPAVETTINAPWQWSFGIGAGLQYEIVPHLKVYMEPSLNYYIPSSEAVETYRTEHPFDLSLPLGIRISW